MKKQQLIAIFSILTVAGCSLLGGDDDDDKDDSGLESAKCLLASFTVTSSWGDDFESMSNVETFSLNHEDGRLVGIMNNYSYEYCESTNCETESGIAEAIFIYSGGELASVELYEDGMPVAGMDAQFEFERNRIIRQVFNDDGYIDEYRYTYNNNGQLVREENWDNYSWGVTELTLYSMDEYSYSNGNLVSSTHSWNDLSSGRADPKVKKRALVPSRILNSEELIMERQSTNTYDDKNNLFGELGALMYLIIEAPEWCYSTNNLLTQTNVEFYEGMTETYVTTSTMEYNDDDYPTSITMSDESGDNAVVTVTYTCN